MGSLPEFDIFTARKGIESLRDGVPPPDEICEWLTTGQRDLIAGLIGGLKQASEGDTNSRILLGSPGEGKTHILRVIRQAARTRHFVIFQCTQDLAGRIMFNRPDLVYTQLIRSMELPADLSSSREPLATLLQLWGRSALPYVRNVNPFTNPIYQLPHQDLLPPASSIPKRTAHALFGYLRALEREDSGTQEIMTNVLRGMKIENRAIIKSAEKVGAQPQFIGYTPTSYDNEYWMGQFAVICFMARAIRVVGCMLLLDEIESLIDLNNVASRRKAYEVLNHFITNKASIGSLFSLLSCTPSFMMHLRGDVRSEGDRVFREWGCLETTKLSRLLRNDALVLVEKLGALHAIAYNLNAEFRVTSEHEAIISEWLTAQAPISELVRSIVTSLDNLAN
jgi:hypothetical protein